MAIASGRKPPETLKLRSETEMGAAVEKALPLFAVGTPITSPTDAVWGHWCCGDEPRIGHRREDDAGRDQEFVGGEPFVLRNEALKL